MRNPLWAPEYTGRKPSFNDMGAILINSYHPVNRELVSWWLLNDRAGVVCNSVIGGYKGTLSGDAALWVPDGVSIGASEDRIIVSPKIFNFNIGTICLQFTPTWSANSTTYRFLCDTVDTRYTIYKSTTANELIALFDGRQAVYTITGLITAGKICNLALAYNKTGNVQTLYIDGVEVAGVGSGTWGGNPHGANSYIGDRYSGSNYTSAAVFHQVQTFKRVLSAAEILNIYLYPFGTPSSPRFIVEPQRTWFVPVAAGATPICDEHGTWRGHMRGEWRGHMKVNQI